MTATATDTAQTVSDVDTNMMGIRSEKLYNLLKTIVDTGDCSVLNENDPEEVLAEIIKRITLNIPEDAFRVVGAADELQRLKYRLAEIGDYLRRNFQAKGTYPFTILRICELCYDPLKYFRVFELEKFVHAISSCCFVETSWKLFEDCPGQRSARNHSAVTNGDSEQEDVSLTKIPWIDEKTEKKLIPFIKEIDSVMSVNFGFEDDEDDEDESMGVELNQFGGADGDFVIEEYYEKDPGDEDDDDDDGDGDYVEDAQSDTEDDDQDGDSEDEDIDDTRGNPQRKRKTMELDDFEYVEKSARKSKLTTPKIRPKLRDGLIGSPGSSGLSEDQDTPRSSQEEERPGGQSQISSLDQEVSFLISPANKNSSNTFEEGKIRAVTDAPYERDLGSPLSNRAR
ncbi:hypothetical protein HG536_0B03720 [Torulaspora globosa]|uniref:Serine/threonine-protein phosphatase 4 regulatory subunit 2 n=1 Tax=Torulaspora globosa TaxID=48254 RepID=A0A7G3ZDC3_9SACH|nr:uncharacterized protein HG536_0B03720 [Torulaspora globosa]QLL31509.1 hypothetical protein HG536_0B03720 [Torulaspora globosa]